MSMQGQKHLIKCRCILQQFKKMNDPPLHCFITFSVINDDGSVKPRYTQCNNCGVIHRVTDICTSEVLFGKESSPLVTIQDVEASLPDKLVTILRLADADLATYEMAQFIYENKRWGDFVVITTEENDGVKQGKYVRILGEQLFKVETFEHHTSVE